MATNGTSRSLRACKVKDEMVPKYRNMMMLTTGKRNVKQNTKPRTILKFCGAMESIAGK